MQLSPWLIFLGLCNEVNNFDDLNLYASRELPTVPSMTEANVLRGIAAPRERELRLRDTAADLIPHRHGNTIAMAVVPLEKTQFYQNTVNGIVG